MKKNAFTLTEILGVVVILGLIMLVVAPPLLNRVSTHEGEVTEIQLQMLEEAANMYLDKNPSADKNCVPIQTLIDNGYLNKNILNATDKEDTNYKNQQLKTVDPTKRVKHFNIVATC